MASPEASSLLWFIEYMRLLNMGVIPTVTSKELMPDREVHEEFWRPKHESKYMFRNFGSQAYED